MTFANPIHIQGSGPLGFIGIQAWSEDKKAEIIRSRVEGTKELVEAMKKCGSKGPKTLVLQN
jgi:NAD dependent epimerase/dehydratase family enzyme